MSNYILTLPSNTATSNTFLKNDGDGNLSWQDPISRSDKYIFVYQEDDFPNVVGDVHVLDDNVTYIVVNQINMTYGIKFGVNNTINGSGTTSSLHFNDNVTGFLAENVGVNIHNITIYGGGDNGVGLCDFRDIDYDLAYPHGRSMIINIHDVNFMESFKLGIIDGFKHVYINSCIFNGAMSVTRQGFIVTNSMYFLFLHNMLIHFKGFSGSNSGSLLTLGSNDNYNILGESIGFEIVNIGNNVMNTEDHEIGINIEPKFTVHVGNISGNVFDINNGSVGVKYFRSELFDNFNTPCVKNIEVVYNNGIHSSTEGCNGVVYNNSSLTAINFVNTYELFDPPTNVIQPMTISSKIGINMTCTNTIPFQLGEVITGSISGSEAIIVDVISSTEYYLADMTNSFDNNDTISGSKGGSGSFSNIGDGIHFRFRYVGNTSRKFIFNFSALISQISGTNVEWNVTFRINNNISPLIGTAFVDKNTRPKNASITSVSIANKGDFIDFMVKNLDTDVDCIIRNATFSAL